MLKVLKVFNVVGQPTYRFDFVEYTISDQGGTPFKVFRRNIADELIIYYTIHEEKLVLMLS